jgi:phage shock protein A
MGLFQRVNDIISANLNDMVEQYEDPEKMLRQAIREMETAIDGARQETAKAMASARLSAKSLAEHQGHQGEWQRRAEQAVQAGDDGLARKALSRKQEYDKIVAALGDEASATAETSQTLRRQLEAMQAKLAEAKRRLGTLAARKKAADVRLRMQNGAVVAALDQRAFDKFDRLREKVERAEAEAEALRELCGPASAFACVPEPSPEPTGVEAELAALKRKLARPSA